MNQVGPIVTVEVAVRCGECVHRKSVKYTCQSDWGYDNYCTAFADQPDRLIGKNVVPTPKWCPYIGETRKSALLHFAKKERL